MKSRKAQRVIPLLKVLLGLGLIVIIFFSINLSELYETLLQCRIPLIFLCIAFHFIIFSLQASVLGIISSPFAQIAYGQLMLFTLIGRFFSLFLPSSVGGDLVKAVYIIPYFRNASEAYAAIIMHRLLGGLSTIAVALIASVIFLPPHYTTLIWSIICSILFGVTVVLAVYYLYKRRIWGWIRIHREKRAQAIGVVGFFYSLISAVFAYRNARLAVIFAFSASAFGTVITALFFMLTAYTLRIPLGFDQALVCAGATQISVLLPLTPGGIGVTEGTFVGVANIMGVAPEHAFAIMILARFTGYIAAIPGGILYMVTSVGKNGNQDLTKLS